MAQAFNLTAQLNLRGPNNIRQIAAKIRKDLGNINANVTFKLDPSAIKNTTALAGALNKLNASFITTSKSAGSATSAIKAFGAAVSSINIKNVPQQLNASASAITKLNSSAQSSGKAIATASTEMQEFGRQAGLAVRRFTAFSTVTSIIYGVTNSVNQGVQAFIDYDKELVKLQQVTGESAQGLGKLQSQISSLSVGLGVSSKELTTVALTLAQAGLSAKDTERSLRALALSSLAPSFDNMNETVEGSIALMRQFDISAAELEQSLGAVNAVSAKFAVEASDIITAIQRTGSVFATASKGVSEGKDALNEFIAVFTSVRATTRESAETIATGLRTIFTRIQRSSTIDALKEFGVNLTDAEGKFVGAYKAVQLLSQGLSSIDPRSLQFSKIVEELGGFRQIGKVIPLIQQFSVAQEALKVAQKGQSSLANDAAVAQLSLANQISKVREEFFALFREIGSSKGFQTIVRGALDLTSGLLKLADAAKSLLPALTVLVAFKGAKALTQFASGFASGVRPQPGNNKNAPERFFNKGGQVLKFARGGVVPGQGNRDTVPAMLQPGEFVIRKKAVETIGTQNLHKMNKYAGGGKVRVDYADKDILTKDVDTNLQNAVSSIAEQLSPTSTKIPTKNVKNLPNYAGIIGSLFEGGLGLSNQRNYGKKNLDTKSFDFPSGIKSKAYNLQNLTSDAKKSFVVKGGKYNDPGKILRKIGSYAKEKNLDIDNLNKDFGVAVMSPGSDDSFDWKPQDIKAAQKNKKNRGGQIKKFMAGGVAEEYYGQAEVEAAKAAFEAFQRAAEEAYSAENAYFEIPEGKSIAEGVTPEVYGTGIGKLKKGQPGIVGVKRLKLTDPDAVSNAQLIKDLKIMQESMRASALKAREAQLVAYAQAEESIVAFKTSGLLENIDPGIVSYIKDTIASLRAGTIDPDIWDSKSVKKIRAKLTDPNLEAFDKLMGEEAVRVSVQGQRTKLSEVFNRILETYGSNVSQSEQSNITSKIADITLKQMAAEKANSGGMIQKFMAGGVAQTETISKLLSDLDIETKLGELGGAEGITDAIGVARLGQLVREKIKGQSYARMLLKLPTVRKQLKSSKEGEYRAFYTAAIQEAEQNNQGAAANLANLESQAKNNYAGIFGGAGMYQEGSFDSGRINLIPDPKKSRAIDKLKGPASIELIPAVLAKDEVMKQARLQAAKSKKADLNTQLGIATSSTAASIAQEYGAEAQLERISQFNKQSAIAYVSAVADALDTKSDGSRIFLDFDKTLAYGADEIGKVEGSNKIDLSAFSDINKVKTGLGNAKLSSLSKKLIQLSSDMDSKQSGLGSELLKRMFVVSARPSNTMSLIAGWLNSQGLNIPAGNFVGVGGTGLSEADIAIAKAKEIIARGGLKQGSVFIDDDPNNIQQAISQGIISKQYGATMTPQFAREATQSEGLDYQDLVRQTLLSYDQTLANAITINRQGQSLDFPNGLGPLASTWFDEPRLANVPTDVKRTITQSKVIENIANYLRIAKGYAFGGRVNGQQKFALGGLAEATNEMSGLMSGLYGNRSEQTKQEKKEKQFGKIALRKDGNSVSATYFKNDTRSGNVSAYKMRDYLYYVGLSQATGGYGPRLYDAVMEAVTADGAMLTSDRSSVSGDAKRVWDYYFKNRSDVDKTPLKPDDWTKNQSMIDPKLFGPKDSWPPSNDPAWVLQSGYSKRPSLINDPNSVIRMDQPTDSRSLAANYFAASAAKFAKGGSPKDTVPALLTPGEFVINKQAAKRIGYGKLQQLNKADKVQGYNKGGAVGLIQRFATGGLVEGFVKDLIDALGQSGLNRPETISRATIGVDKATIESVKEFNKQLNELGISFQNTAEILNAGGRTSYKELEKAMKKDVERLQLSGAGLDVILEAENKLAAVRKQRDSDVKMRQNLEGSFGGVAGRTSGSVQQEILLSTKTRAESSIQKLEAAKLSAAQREQAKQQAAAIAQKGSPLSEQELKDIKSRTIDQAGVTTQEKKDIYEKSALRSTAQITGTSTKDLKSQNITGSDILKYAEESLRDRKTLAEMDKQYVTIKMQEYQNAGKTASEARKLAEQEVSERRQIINNLASQRGEAGVGSRSMLDFKNSPIANALGQRYLTSNKREPSLFGTGIKGTLASDIGLAAGLVGGQGQTIAKQIYGSSDSPENQMNIAKTGAAIEQAGFALSTGLTAASQMLTIPVVGPWLAGLTALGTAVYAAVDYFTDFSGAQKAATLEMERSLKATALENSADRLDKAFKNLEANVADVKLQQALERAFSEQNIAASSLGLTELKQLEQTKFKSMGTFEWMMGAKPDISNNDISALSRTQAERSGAAASKAFAAVQFAIDRGITSIDELAKNKGAVTALGAGDVDVQKEVNTRVLGLAQRMGGLEKVTDAQKQSILEEVSTRAFLNNAQIQAAIKSKQLADSLEAADRAGRKLAESYDRLFDSIEQSINRIQYEASERKKLSSGRIRALSGESEASQISLRETNILQNRKAYSPQEFEQAVSSATASLPGDAGTRLKEAATLETQVGDNINAAVAAALKGRASTGIDQAAEIAKTTAKAQVDALNIGDELKASIKSQIDTRIEGIQKQVTEKSGGNQTLALEQFQEEAAKAGGIIGDIGTGAMETILKLMQERERALNTFVEDMNQAAQSAKEAAALFRKARDIRGAGQRNLREVMTGVGETYDDTRNRVMGEVGALTGGITDPTQIRQQIQAMSAQRENEQKNFDKVMTDKGATEKDREQAAKRFNDFNTALSNAKEGLDILANSTELVDKAFDDLKNARELQKNRESFVNQLLTNTPEEADKLSQTFIRLQRNLSGGLNTAANQRDARKEFNQTLRQTGSVREATRAGNAVLANQRKETLGLMQDSGFRASLELQMGNAGMNEAQIADRMKQMETQLMVQMARESGMINNPLVQQAIAAKQDPNADPMVQQRANKYLEAVGLQAKATEEQATLKVDESNRLLIGANTELTMAINDLNKTIAAATGRDKGIETGETDAKGNKLVNPGVKAVGVGGKARGGIVYANLGQLIDFKPRGTDTVPAMLTPGEFVINAQATAQHLPLLEAINSGKVSGYNKGGMVYLQKGGQAKKDSDATTERLMNSRNPLALNDALRQNSGATPETQAPARNNAVTTQIENNSTQTAPATSNIDQLRQERDNTYQQSMFMAEGARAEPAARAWTADSMGAKWDTMSEEDRNNAVQKNLPRFQQLETDYNARRDAYIVEKGKRDEESGLWSSDRFASEYRVNFFQQERDRSKQNEARAVQAYDQANLAAQAQQSGASAAVVSYGPQPPSPKAVSMQATIDRSVASQSAASAPQTAAQIYAQQAQAMAPKTRADLPKPKKRSDLPFYQEGVARGMTIDEVKYEKQQAYLNGLAPEARDRELKSLTSRNMLAKPSARQNLMMQARQAEQQQVAINKASGLELQAMLKSMTSKGSPSLSDIANAKQALSASAAAPGELLGSTLNAEQQAKYNELESKRKKGAYSSKDPLTKEEREEWKKLHRGRALSDKPTSGDNARRLAISAISPMDRSPEQQQEYMRLKYQFESSKGRASGSFEDFAKQQNDLQSSREARRFAALSQRESLSSYDQKFVDYYKSKEAAQSQAILGNIQRSEAEFGDLTGTIQTGIASNERVTAEAKSRVEAYKASEQYVKDQAQLTDIENERVKAQFKEFLALNVGAGVTDPRMLAEFYAQNAEQYFGGLDKAAKDRLMLSYEKQAADYIQSGSKEGGLSASELKTLQEKYGQDKEATELINLKYGEKLEDVESSIRDRVLGGVTASLDTSASGTNIERVRQQAAAYTRAANELEKLQTVDNKAQIEAYKKRAEELSSQAASFSVKDMTAESAMASVINQEEMLRTQRASLEASAFGSRVQQAQSSQELNQYASAKTAAEQARLAEEQRRASEQAARERQIKQAEADRKAQEQARMKAEEERQANLWINSSNPLVAGLGYFAGVGEATGRAAYGAANVVAGGAVSIGGRAYQAGAYLAGSETQQAAGAAFAQVGEQAFAQGAYSAVELAQAVAGQGPIQTGDQTALQRGDAARVELARQGFGDTGALITQGAQTTGFVAAQGAQMLAGAGFSTGTSVFGKAAKGFSMLDNALANPGSIVGGAKRIIGTGAKAADAAMLGGRGARAATRVGEDLRFIGGAVADGARGLGRGADFITGGRLSSAATAVREGVGSVANSVRTLKNAASDTLFLRGPMRNNIDAAYGAMGTRSDYFDAARRTYARGRLSPEAAMTYHRAEIGEKAAQMMRRDQALVNRYRRLTGGDTTRASEVLRSRASRLDDLKLKRAAGMRDSAISERVGLRRTLDWLDEAENSRLADDAAFRQSRIDADIEKGLRRQAQFTPDQRLARRARERGVDYYQTPAGKQARDQARANKAMQRANERNARRAAAYDINRDAGLRRKYFSTSESAAATRASKRAAERGVNYRTANQTAIDFTKIYDDSGRLISESSGFGRLADVQAEVVSRKSAASKVLPPRDKKGRFIKKNAGLAKEKAAAAAQQRAINSGIQTTPVPKQPKVSAAVAKEQAAAAAQQRAINSGIQTTPVPKQPKVSAAVAKEQAAAAAQKRAISSGTQKTSAPPQVKPRAGAGASSQLVEAVVSRQKALSKRLGSYASSEEAAKKLLADNAFAIQEVKAQAAVSARNVGGGSAVRSAGAAYSPSKQSITISQQKLQSPTLSSTIEHELAHAMQRNTVGGMRKTATGQLEYEQKLMDSLGSDINTFLSNKSGYNSLLQELQQGPSVGSMYSANRIKLEPVELFSSLVQASSSPNFTRNPAAVDMLKKLMKFHGYAKGGLVYLKDGGMPSSNIALSSLVGASSAPVVAGALTRAAGAQGAGVVASGGVKGSVGTLIGTGIDAAFGTQGYGAGVGGAVDIGVETASRATGAASQLRNAGVALNSAVGAQSVVGAAGTGLGVGYGAYAIGSAIGEGVALYRGEKTLQDYQKENDRQTNQSYLQNVGENLYNPGRAGIQLGVGLDDLAKQNQINEQQRQKNALKSAQLILAGNQNIAKSATPLEQSYVKELKGYASDIANTGTMSLSRDTGMSGSILVNNRVVPQSKSSGGIIYANNGALASLAQGTDTVPAMLTPGEFVVNKEASQRHMPLLHAINSGHFNRGGIVNYLANGGIVAPRYYAGAGPVLPNGGAQRQASGVSTNIGADIGAVLSEALNSAVGQFNEFATNITTGLQQSMEQYGQVSQTISQSMETFSSAAQIQKSSAESYQQAAAEMPNTINTNVTGNVMTNHTGLDRLTGNIEQNIYSNTAKQSNMISQNTVAQVDRTAYEGNLNTAANAKPMK